MLRLSLVLLTLLACRGDEAPTESASPCEGYVPTWEGWTQGFFRTWCGACHSSTSVDRNGAPEGVNFDTESGALQWRDRVRARVIEDGSMPIGGGVYADELALLEAWLDCAADGADDVPDGASPMPDPAWSDDEARTAFGAALTLPLGDPYALRDTYLSLFDHRDAECPATNDYNLPVTRVGCTSRSGWTYAGPTTYDVQQSEDLLNLLLWNDCEILGPGGERWMGAGTLGLYVATTSEGVEWSLKLGGSWSWSESEGWLGMEPSGVIGAFGTKNGDNIVVDYDGVSTIGGYSLDLRTVHLDTERCPRGTGELALRDPNGGWFTVLLGSDCTGCGEMRYGDRSLGQYCPNVAGPLRDLSAAVLP